MLATNPPRSDKTFPNSIQLIVPGFDEYRSGSSKSVGKRIEAIENINAVRQQYRHGMCRRGCSCIGHELDDAGIRFVSDRGNHRR